MFTYTLRSQFLLICLGIAIGISCSDDDLPGDTDSGAGTAMPDASTPMLCEDSPDASAVGEARPFASFGFLNAFDPTDTQEYDPDDAASLRGPLMVDTWGDRSTGAHGTLGVFPPGFSSPPHTHTNDYYGVVLRGRMTNPFGSNLDVFFDADDANNHGAEILEPGSHWFVPGGSQHATTCMGPEICWFYFHAEALFDFAPIVDDAGALQDGVALEASHPDAVPLPREDLEFAGEPGSFVQFAPAWGSMENGPHGTFGIFNAGAASPGHVHSAEYHGVVISGGLTNPFSGESDPPLLDTGGYWRVPAASPHVTACEDGEDCLFYFHSRGGFDFTPLCE